MRLGTNLWIYTVPNTPNSISSTVSSSATSGKDPISHGPIFHVSMLGVVASFFWFSCIIVMFYLLQLSSAILFCKKNATNSNSSCTITIMRVFHWRNALSLHWGKSIQHDPKHERNRSMCKINSFITKVTWKNRSMCKSNSFITKVTNETRNCYDFENIAM